MSAQDTIKQQVTGNKVVLYMKGSPDFPQCGFSGQVIQILNYMDVSYKPVNCLASDEIRQGIKDFSDWPTIRDELDNYGCALTGELLTPDETAAIRALYTEDSRFRSTNGPKAASSFLHRE